MDTITIKEKKYIKVPGGECSECAGENDLNICQSQAAKGCLSDKKTGFVIVELTNEVALKYDVSL